MPTSPAGPCLVPRCPGRAVSRGRCEIHAPQQEASRPNVEVRRWYSTPAWRALRQRVLAEQPLCVTCLDGRRMTVATDVDHIARHRGDTSLFWDRANLQALCHACHSAKTRAGY